MTGGLNYALDNFPESISSSPFAFTGVIVIGRTRYRSLVKRWLPGDENTRIGILFSGEENDVQNKSYCGLDALNLFKIGFRTWVFEVRY